MVGIEIEIEGAGVIAATEDLQQLEGLQAVYETEGETTQDGWLAVIATIITMTADSLDIATKIYE